MLTGNRRTPNKDLRVSGQVCGISGINMSKIQTLRGFINQRLSLAAEEIFELFERTIAEYEEQLCRSKEENQRQRKSLEAVYNPYVELNQTDCLQLSVRTEEVPPEQQEGSTRPSQEDPQEPALIKEEQEELWSSQEAEQLPGLKEEKEEEVEEDIIKFTFTPVPGCHVESSQIHENQREEERDSECLMKEAEGTHFQHFQPVSPEETSHVSVSQVSNSCHHEGTSQSQPGLNAEAGEKVVSCRVCGKGYHRKRALANHMRLHSEGHDLSCSFCGKTFQNKRDFENHVRVHTGEKPFSCSVCYARFTQRSHMTLHLRIHTGEKPHTCSVCNASFTTGRTLRDHMTIHTGEKPHSCSVCGKKFAQKGALRRHMATHTGVKRYYCRVCERQFARLEHVKNHKCGDTSGRGRRHRRDATETPPQGSFFRGHI